MWTSREAGADFDLRIVALEALIISLLARIAALEALHNPAGPPGSAHSTP